MKENYFHGQKTIKSCHLSDSLHFSLVTTFKYCKRATKLDCCTPHISKNVFCEFFLQNAYFSPCLFTLLRVKWGIRSDSEPSYQHPSQLEGQYSGNMISILYYFLKEEYYLILNHHINIHLSLWRTVFF